MAQDVYKDKNNEAIFTAALSADTLIRLDKRDNSLNYDEEFLSRKKVHLDNIAQSREPFVGIHAGACAILCGAGHTYNKTLTEQAFLKGHVIIAIGSGLLDNPYASYWIGSESPVNYSGALFRRDNCIKFVDTEHMQHRFFSAQVNRFRGETVNKYPGVFEVMNKKGKDIYGDLPINSFYKGLYLASRLGISDVVLNGIPLGASLEDPGKWYSPAITMSSLSNFIASKEKPYKDIIADFNNRLCSYMLRKYYMRIYTTEVNSPFRYIPYIPIELMLTSLARQVELSAPGNTRQRLLLSYTEKTRLDDIVKIMEQTKLDTLSIGHHSSALIKLIPELFDTDLIRNNTKEFNEEIAKKGSCSSCSANKLMGYTLRTFITGLSTPAHRDKLLEFWKQNIDKRCYAIGSELMFPPWEDKIAEEYNNLKGK
jgi:hypothetical protein